MAWFVVARVLFVVVEVKDRELQDARMKSGDVRKVAEIIEPFGQRPTAFEVFERP